MLFRSIDQLATRIIEVADGEVRVFPGNYQDYLWRKSGGPAAVIAAATPAVVAAAEAPVVAEEPSQAKEKRVNPIKLRQMQERCEFLENEIGRFEAEIAECEAALMNYKSAEESLRLANKMDELRAKAAAATAEWEETAAQL